MIPDSTESLTKLPQSLAALDLDCITANTKTGMRKKTQVSKVEAPNPSEIPTLNTVREHLICL